MNRFEETDPFKVADMLVMKDRVFGTTIWEDNLQGVVDSLSGTDVVTVIAEEDSSGWIKVVSSKGSIGLVHRMNVDRVVQSCSGTL